MPIEVLDPTWGDGRAAFEAAPRAASLDGAVIGIVSNGKSGTRAFFDALAHELRTSYGAGDVEIAVKSNYSAPAEPTVMDRAQRWNALVSGIGD